MEYAASVTAQADGKLVAAGISNNGSDIVLALARYHADGSLDMSFNGTGKLFFAAPQGYKYSGSSITEQANGKLVVAGSMTAVGFGGESNSDFMVMRIESGQLDLDGDGLVDWLDTDNDGDGVTNTQDAFPLSPAEWLDTDADGVGNNADPDDDGDGLPDSVDANPLNPSVGMHLDGAYRGATMSESAGP